MLLAGALRRKVRYVRNAVLTRRMIGRLRAAHAGNSNLAVLIATPTHGNLGDHAIVQSQRKFLANALPDYEMFEIHRYQYELAKDEIGEILGPGDVIVVDGGGNVGTLWPEENGKMNDIVRRFSDNPTVIFPQTAFFEGSSAGEECRQEVSAAYASNPNLLFFSRDRATYETMCKVSPGTRNLYVPDIVLYLNESRDDVAREGALLCLRNDKERLTDGHASGYFLAELEGRGFTVRETSTVVDSPRRVDAGNREKVLEEKWNEFRSAAVVVTDRLHGMIFSAITGTPCVALDNVSHKVSQGYEWIRGIPNIRVAASADEVPALLDAVLEEGPCRYDRSPLDPYYDRMKAAIRSVID